MKLIVGLGNPGIEYENTRHNIGFIIIDDYVKKNNLDDFKFKFNGLYTKIFINDSYHVILKPLSFMNLSGTVIKKYMDYFKIKNDDILIIQDDIDLPVGKIKIKYKGSSGGHNGIKNIIENLHTEEFARFKVGISRNENIAIKNYVIGHLSDADKDKINKICEFSNNIIDDFIKTDIEKVMSKYNGAEYEIK